MPAVYDVRERAQSTPSTQPRTSPTTRARSERQRVHATSLNQTTDIRGRRGDGRGADRAQSLSMTTNSRLRGLRRPLGLAVGSVVGGLLAYVFFALVTRALGPGRRRAGLGAVGVVGLRRRGADLPAPALDHPHGHRARRGAGAAPASPAGWRSWWPPRRAVAGLVAWLARDLLFGRDRRGVPAARRRGDPGLRAAGRGPRHADRPAPVRAVGASLDRRERAALRRRGRRWSSPASTTRSRTARCLVAGYLAVARLAVALRFGREGSAPDPGRRWRWSAASAWASCSPRSC